MANAGALMQWEEQGIVPTQQKLADFIQYFQSMVSVNNEGQPMYLIDPTVIAECVPFAETTDDVTEEKYNQSIVRIDFEDSVPCIDGLPIWERLDGEAIPYYKIFKEYRDMKYVNDTHLNTRSMARLSEMLNVPGRLIGILAKIYHWMPRVYAYDQQKRIDLALRKQRNRDELESKHAKYSKEVLAQAVTYLQNNVEKLDPKTALQMMELGMKYGRISIGLLGDKPGSSTSTGSAGVHQTNIAISQTNSSNQADKMLNVHTVGGDRQGGANGQGGSMAERQLDANMRDESQLMSVLHVLKQSGAFKAVAAPEVRVDEDDEEAKFDMYDDGTDIRDIITIDEDDVTYVSDDESTEQQNATAHIDNDKAVPGTQAEEGGQE